MKFLVDESSDARLASFLTDIGHDATTVARDYTASVADSEVLKIAFREQRILITNDRDFGDLIFRRGQPHCGVIYLRLSTTSLTEKIERLSAVFESHGTELEQFIVVTDRRVRIRREAPESSNS